MRRGFSITEMPGGVVNEVSVHNPTELPVLLYEGELILGAAQNRTFDQPVLVPAGARLTVSVSCVEAGRWDIEGGPVGFATAGDALDPSLRAAKRASAAASGRPDQRAVWGEVQQRLSSLEVDSPSEALTDVYAARDGELSAFQDAIELCPGQLGAVTHIHGCPVALDVVSSPRVFGDLFPGLMRGYALQALTGTGPAAVFWPGVDVAAGARRLLHDALGTGWDWVAGVGMGDLYAPRGPVAGCALRLGRELVACSAFPRR